eukprot:TRINITY_DN61561_c0_g2_i1.p1 TRINITY_DN61561_c0_g2~~TRINITY_DN61561_c0_g2_i1.p1  ORF type:complete len:206 (-),score=32.15 TRINITY_DN61561_c0_g2_i1:592-1209(-)
MVDRLQDRIAEYDAIKSDLRAIPQLLQHLGEISPNTPSIVISWNSGTTTSPPPMADDAFRAVCHELFKWSVATEVKDIGHGRSAFGFVAGPDRAAAEQLFTTAAAHAHQGNRAQNIANFHAQLDFVPGVACVGAGYPAGAGLVHLIWMAAELERDMLTWSAAQAAAAPAGTTALAAYPNWQGYVHIANGNSVWSDDMSSWVKANF